MAKNYLERESFYWLKLLGDGLLLTLSFLLAYYFKRGHLYIEKDFQVYFAALMVIWFVCTIFSKKFMKIHVENYLLRIKPFLVSALTLTALVSFYVYTHGLYHLSRLVVYGTIAIFLTLEFFYLVVRTYMWRRSGRIKRIPFPVIFFLMELLMVISAFLAVHYFHKGTVRMTDEYMLMLIGIFFTWLLISLLNHQFTINWQKNLIRMLLPFWRSELMIGGLIASFIFISNLAAFSRFIILGSLLSISIAENLVVLFYFLYYKVRGPEDEDTALFTAKIIEYRPVEVEQEPRTAEEEAYEFSGNLQSAEHLGQMLKNVYLHRSQELLDFLQETVDLERIDVTRSAVVFSPYLEQLSVLPDKGLQLFVNLHRVNDFRRVNRNFITVNHKMTEGGVFVCQAETVRQRLARIYRLYPLPLARMFHFFDFVVNRVMPKLPVFKRLYFVLSQGRSRVLSFTEVMGRLFYCGFKVISWREIDGFIYFVMRKDKEPSTDTTPSYGPLFRQRRVGKDGKIIYIYKFRTMHPYAEYIQNYVHRHNRLADSGKIKNDFRVTYWGRFLRRFLLDELPMILNWLKRDIKLVGVRPLSEAFFSTYPVEFQEIRNRFKPGLIPPYYADMPTSMEQVIESERRYLERYEKRPFRTDLRYFFKVLNNLVFHHAKSS
jgi:lipopolysaccharide/colanic/teichoic acid biosynthesis glycosyltransferase